MFFQTFTVNKLKQMEKVKEKIMYSRTELVEWVNTILQTSYNNLNEISITTLALLVYGVFIHSSSSSSSSSSHPPLSSASKLLSITLQQIDFTQINTTRNVEYKYTELILQLIRKLSSLHKATAVDNAQSSKIAAISNHNLHIEYQEHEQQQQQQQHEEESYNKLNMCNCIDLNVDVNDWISGRAFVEELRVWRWLRETAEQYELKPEHIYQNICTYIGSSSNNNNEKKKNYRNDQGEKENTESATKRIRSETLIEQDSNDSKSDSKVTVKLSQLFHKRNEYHDSDGNVFGESYATPVISENVCGNVTKLIAASHISAIEFAEAIKMAYTPEQQQQEKEELLLEWEEEEEEEDKEKKKKHALIEQMNATDHITDTEIKQIDCVDKDNNSSTSTSTLHVTGLADALKSISNFCNEYTQSVNNKDSKENITLSSNNNDGSDSNYYSLSQHADRNDNLTRSHLPCTNIHTCSECPLIFAHALQCNLNLISEMEAARKAAIEACRKRDVVALFSALSKFA